MAKLEAATRPEAGLEVLKGTKGIKGRLKGQAEKVNLGTSSCQTRRQAATGTSGPSKGLGRGSVGSRRPSPSSSGPVAS